jgi:hypothetical protein
MDSAWGGGGGEVVQFLFFLNPDNIWGEWSASRPGRNLLPGKERLVPTVQEARWATEPVWTQRIDEKPSASVGIEHRSLSP